MFDGLPHRCKTDLAASQSCCGRAHVLGWSSGRQRALGRVANLRIPAPIFPSALRNVSSIRMSARVSQAKVFGALVASFPLAYVVWQTQVCAHLRQ